MLNKINRFKGFSALVLLFIFLFAVNLPVFAGDPDKTAAEASGETKTQAGHSESKFDAGTMITEHISDAHEWHLWGEHEHAVSVPLPIIIKSSRGFDVFMSSKFHHGQDSYKGYRLLTHDYIHQNHIEGYNADQVVAVDQAGEIDEAVTASIIDLSITKNTLALFVSIAIMLIVFLSVAKAYKKRPGQAPKGLQSFIEPLVLFVRDDIAKASIGEKHYKRFMPYLLTVFFFIWINNLLGLIPIIPGGANLTGNIAVTMVLALITFIITSFSGNKHYWGHIFAMPGVPKPMLLLLTPIEILGMFLRPFVLMIRLFANITAGHIIALSFFALIFIFGEMSKGAGYGVGIFSTLFVVFMTFLELLVAFLQAYVFTLLSAVYFSAAVEEHHEHH